jgi:hypothetical protein
MPDMTDTRCSAIKVTAAFTQAVDVFVRGLSDSSL